MPLPLTQQFGSTVVPAVLHVVVWERVDIACRRAAIHRAGMKNFMVLSWNGGTVRVGIWWMRLKTVRRGENIALQDTCVFLCPVPTAIRN